MGILNALTLLEESDGAEFSASELTAMARKNAQQLHRTLSELLDLASIDSKAFHLRLREIDLPRLVHARILGRASSFRDHGVEVSTPDGKGKSAIPVLADPQKLGRAIDLCLDAILAKVERGTVLVARVQAHQVEFEFKLQAGLESLWSSHWEQSAEGARSGVGSPGSAFAEAMKTEQEFLTRVEEGLGSELLLVHEIMRRHEGGFSCEQKGLEVKVKLEVPELSSEEGLRAVLASRALSASTEVNSVALSLLAVPAGTPVGKFQEQVRRALFRSTDAAYLLPESKQVALVMDDCKPEDGPRLLARIERSLGQKLKHGTVNCPADGADPFQLIELARRRLQSPA